MKENQNPNQEAKNDWWNQISIFIIKNIINKLKNVNIDCESSNGFSQAPWEADMPNGSESLIIY